MAALFKHYKRAYAAEFSRDLSKKVRAAQGSAIGKGYHVGNLPTLGFARVAVSKTTGKERLLRPGEYKAGRGEHVRWILGPQDEVDTVRRIFEIYARTEINVVNLAKQLRAEGVVSSRGRPITQWALYSFLRSEAVIGNFVWGRRVLKKRRKESDPRFCRVTGFVEAIVSRDTFDRVQAKLNRRAHYYFTKEQILDRLKAALQVHPKLRASELKAHGCADQQTYKTKFGSIPAAWEAAGAVYPLLNERDHSRMVKMHNVGSRTCKLIHALLTGAGVQCDWFTRPDRRGERLLINGNVVLRVQVIFRGTRQGVQIWKRNRVYSDFFDWALIVRTEADGTMVDSMLMRRDEYFDHGMWIEDDLSISGAWTFQNSMSDVAKLFSSLSPAPAGCGPGTAPNHRTRITPQPPLTKFVT